MDRTWEDPELISPAVLRFLHSANHVCVNVEGALYDGANTEQESAFSHIMNPQAATALQKIKADIWSIGNNHIMDAQLAGLLSTQDIAKSINSRTFGAGHNPEEASRPLYFSEAGGIGMIGVTYMNDCDPSAGADAGIFRWDNMELIAKRIAEIKETCRWCIVVAHGGDEFAALPLPCTRARYLQYLEMGADIVVGHHPHVPENFEMVYGNKTIFYSLGNFIYDTDYLRVHNYTDRGILIKLNFTENYYDFEYMGIRIDRQNKRIKESFTPDIFTHIADDAYDLLGPLSAKVFVEEEKRKLIYLKPERFIYYTAEDWMKYFAAEPSDNYVPGIHTDLKTILPYSKLADEGLWYDCEAEKVMNYILQQVY